MQSVSSDYFDYYFGWENSRRECSGRDLAASHPKVVYYSQKVAHYPNFDPTYLTNGWEFGDET